jgi:hypothetical protein
MVKEEAKEESSAAEDEKKGGAGRHRYPLLCHTGENNVPKPPSCKRRPPGCKHNKNADG